MIGLGVICASASIVIGYSVGAPYLESNRRISHHAALADRIVQATGDRGTETNAAEAPPDSGWPVAWRQAFDRAWYGDQRWTWLAIALAATTGTLSIILGVRLSRVELKLRRLEEDKAVEMSFDEREPSPRTAPPPSPVDSLRAAIADVDEAKREARDALSVDPTLLGREEVLPLQAALLEDDLLKLRRSRIALENRFSANLALGFDAGLQGRIAQGGDFVESPPATGLESAKSDSPA